MSRRAPRPPGEEDVWAVGDTAYLKSGSPRMTVVAVEDQVVALAWCKYDTGEMQTAKLPIATIQRGWK